MSVHETDKIFDDYKSGEKTIEETNEALKESGANFHLETMTDEEREAKKRREDEAGFIDNPDFVPSSLPKKVDMSRRTDLVGRPACERILYQHTAYGVFKVEYNEQGYAVSASKVESKS